MINGTVYCPGVGSEVSINLWYFVKVKVQYSGASVFEIILIKTCDKLNAVKTDNPQNPRPLYKLI